LASERGILYSRCTPANVVDLNLDSFRASVTFNHRPRRRHRHDIADGDLHQLFMEQYPLQSSLM